MNKEVLRDLHLKLCNIANLRAIGDHDGVVELSKLAFDLIQQTAGEAALAVYQMMQEGQP